MVRRRCRSGQAFGKSDDLRAAAAANAVVVSPVNGQPLPRGKPFTRDSARDAARKSAAARAQRRSIADALMRMLGQRIIDPDTGEAMTVAERVAAAIIRDATSGDMRAGNVRMMQLLLTLAGEGPEAQDSPAAGKPLQSYDLTRLSDNEIMALAETIS